METGTDATKTCSSCHGPIGYEIKDAHAGFASLPPGKRYRVFHCMNRCSRSAPDGLECGHRHEYL
ncbi:MULTISPECIES: hypothetical protein [Rhodococcus]|uniref:Uncharacterized protein n=1 Tax=Rhodococcus wratislaviensis TaxID=44752 RepID=A0A402CDY1_RHOWR|nr:MULTISPECIES: hypothetical protein [Rhodococcus]OUS95228.1 hypothetical protein CA951_14440 [Rhodococcus sp. NCIMB 12038]GCE41799.1 hypothetical protein Rhow_005458 [Rhodococcus wratislaviensis]